MITASKTELGLHCLWWANQPAEFTTSEASESGTRVHKAIENELRHHELFAILSKEEHAKLSSWREWHAYHDHPEFEPERAMWIDVETGAGSFDSAIENRDYRLAKSSVVYGTADAVLITETKAWIVDWKTGRHAPAAHHNSQLLTLALAVRAAHPGLAIDVSIVHVTDHGAFEDTVTLDDFELDLWLEELRGMHAALPNAVPIAGSWCRKNYCPKYGACPATDGAVDALVTVKRPQLTVLQQAKSITTKQEAAYVFQKAREAQAIMARVWSELRLYVDENGPIDIGNGEVWGKHETKRESIDISANPRAALDILRRFLGSEADSVLFFETNKAVIKAAARRRSETTSIPASKIERDTLDALRALGVVSTKKTSTYDERKLKNESAA